MKKIFGLAAVSMLLLSCGGGVKTPCDCASKLGEMSTAYEEARGDEAKTAELNEKFEQLNKDCEAIAAEMGDEKYMKEMTDCMEK